MDYKSLILPDRLPRHIAIIMDGNGRWAKQQGKPRVFGHHSAVSSVRETTEGCAELGVQYLTLYAFSTENWSRPITEVNALMALLVETLKGEIRSLHKNNIRLRTIGDIQGLPPRNRKALEDGMALTEHNTGLNLVLALNYSAKWEILNAVRQIAHLVKKEDLPIEAISEDLFEGHLSTKGIPDPELLIRTSGETRISNFLLWQIAYTELFFTPVFWPEFRKDHLFQAILEYQRRERRFGKTSEQILPG